MKTKTIITAIILLSSLTSFAQQKKELTKEETVKYINDLFQKSYTCYNNDTKEKWTIESVILDGKTLNINTINNHGEKNLTREYLLQHELPLKIYRRNEFMEGAGEYNVISSNKGNILWFLEFEEDAKRLKNALEHLIKILKAEPDTDPFAN